MKAEVKVAFESETMKIPLARILPTRALPTASNGGAKFTTIEASYPVVGIIEPPIVWRQRDGNYLLLDGHNRLALPMEGGAKEVECIVATGEGWLYLAVLLDLFSRRVVGWATSATNDRFLALAALDQALRSRRARPGLVHHTDRGSPLGFKGSSQRAVASVTRGW
jgi:transposase InsO family protein